MEKHNAQCCHDTNSYSAERERIERKRLLHTQPVQYCTDCVLFISTSGHFFLIRHLPAYGVFIIYRKLITYKGLQGSHLLHWLLLQKQLYMMGPWARAWNYWFSQELTDLIVVKCTRICQPFPRYFPLLFCFYTSVVSNLHLHPLKGPKLLDYKRGAACHTLNCLYRQGIGVLQIDSDIDWVGKVFHSCKSLLVTLG